MMLPATDVDDGHESAVPFGRVGEVAVLTSMLDAAAVLWTAAARCWQTSAFRPDRAQLADALKSPGTRNAIG